MEHYKNMFAPTPEIETSATDISMENPSHATTSFNLNASKDDSIVDLNDKTPSHSSFDNVSINYNAMDVISNVITEEEMFNSDYDHDVSEDKVRSSSHFNSINNSINNVLANSFMQHILNLMYLLYNYT